jgi:hypothetical protein
MPVRDFGLTNFRLAQSEVPTSFRRSRFTVRCSPLTAQQAQNLAQEASLDSSRLERHH